MKRLTSIFLVLAMLLTLAPMNIFAADAESSVFSDMKDTDYYAQAATALEQLDILAGYPDGTFGAEKSITRAEMAAIVCRMIDKEADAEKAKGETAFDDVKSDHWASGYINIASKEGIINGDGNGKFRPEDDVKHEEAIKMVVCALGYGDDIEVDAKDWSKGYLEVADEKGISAALKGTKGNASTRGDVAVMSFNGLTVDLQAPTASLPAGRYVSARVLYLKTTTEDAEIYYTLDGSTPTVNSAKYTKGISLTKNCTVKAITVKNGALVSDVFSAAYTIKRSTGGGSSTPATYTVSFDLNYEGATGAPAAQTITSGEKATMPENPDREGFAFVGWYVDSTYAELFNFATPITKTYTLVARWVDMTDTTDTDSDGLTDPVEIYYGTDKTKADTDEDGLTDFFEISSSNTNPFVIDSNENGTNDADEDFDEDSLTNIQEQTNNCNPYSDDTDMDGLTDCNEINVHNTKPDVEDTDEDGLVDGDEIELGLNPLVQKTDGETLDSERTFAQTLSTDNISDTLLSADNAAIPSLNMNVAGNVDSNTTITTADDETLTTNKSVVGAPISISTTADMSSGESTISFDISGGVAPFSLMSVEDEEETSQYLICKYSENEENTEFEPLDTSYSNGTLSASIDSEGTYFVLDTESFLTNLGIYPLDYFESPAPMMLMSMAEENEEKVMIPHEPKHVRKRNANKKQELSAAPMMLSSVEELEEELTLMSASTIGTRAQADIVFVIDVTGSMGGAIGNVATNVNKFADDLVNKYKINANFSVIEFQDITCDGLDSTIQHKNGSSSWWNARSVNSFKNEINNLYLGYGGDWAETPIDGLAMARNLVSSSSTQKFFVLVTDAPYKEYNQYGIKNMEEMINLLVYDDINVSVITDDWSDYEEWEFEEDGKVSGYKDLYEKTGGVFGNIYDSTFSTTLDAIAGMIDVDVNDGSWIVLDNYETIKLEKAPTSDSTADSDKDGVLDINELTVSRNTNLKEYISAFLSARGLTYERYIELGGTPYVTVWSFKSRPDDADTDDDGYIDSKDSNPKKWNVSDRDLAMCASMSYSFIPAGTIINNASVSLTDELNKRFKEAASVNELKNWKVVDTWYAGGGLQAIAYKIDSNIVVAYRGTDEGVDWFNNATTYVLGLSTHTGGAKKFMKQVMKDYSGNNFYVTGHSLGGHLAYNAAAEGINYDISKIKGIVTFNGLGLTLGLTLFGDVWDEAQLLKKPSVIRNYSVEGDPVSKGFLGFTTFHYGTTYTYKQSAKAPDAHNLYTFLDNLEPLSRR